MSKRRFDLASVLTRSTTGVPLGDAADIVRRLATDAALQDAKLIAEPWDCGGLYTYIVMAYIVMVYVVMAYTVMFRYSITSAI